MNNFEGDTGVDADFNGKNKIDIETVDDITNEVMDIIRDRFKINPDSDIDDEIYTEIHNAIRGQLL